MATLKKRKTLLSNPIPLIDHGTGATRSADAEGIRFDLICPTALRRVAAIYHEGAVQHGVNNYCQGLPIADTIHHAINHLQLFLQGDRSEDHLAKVAWGMFTSMHFESACLHHRNLEALRFADNKYRFVNEQDSNVFESYTTSNGIIIRKDPTNGPR
jgi:hypothetical protein